MARWTKHMAGAMGEGVGSEMMDEMEPGGDAPGIAGAEVAGW